MLSIKQVFLYRRPIFQVIHIMHLNFEPEHPWLKEGGEASHKHPDNVVLARMKRFRTMNQMKKLALKVRQNFQLCIKFEYICSNSTQKCKT